jgi:hypothetical protein
MTEKIFPAKCLARVNLILFNPADTLYDAMSTVLSLYRGCQISIIFYRRGFRPTVPAI